MAPLKILICGGGCAGPALAFWLAKGGHQVVVVERYPILRESGAQIDLRGPGIEAIRRMGLLETFRANRVNEAGMSFVDSAGNTRGTIMANTSGKGVQTVTSEYEFMRGDIVRILYNETKDSVKYIFGVKVDRFDQDDEQVTAYFSDGTSDTFDLLVGADGQGSRIRRDIMDPAAPDPYRRLGIHIAYWFIPRIETDTNISCSYLSPGGRMIMRRTHSDDKSHVYFMLRDSSEEITSLHRAPVEQQKAFWTQKFRGAGWQTQRFLDALETTDNFYCQEIVQVRTDTWHKGRVVLLGDAAFCPSPLSGMGTTCSFAGAYVLAGEINRHSDDLPRALANYDQVLRPLINEVQEMNLGMVRWAIPDSQWMISLIHFIAGVLCFLRIPELAARFAPKEGGGWELPVYSEMEKSL